MVWLQGGPLWQMNLTGLGGIGSHVLVACGALETRAVLVEGEYWRILTATVLHTSLPHLFLNAIALLQIGQFVEEWFGSAVFLTICVVFGAFSNVVSIVAHADERFLQAGSSGALFGLLAFAAAVALHGRKRWHRQLWWVAVICLAGGLAAGTWIRADNYAHVGGAIVGGAFGMVEFAFRPGVIPKRFADAAAFLTVAGLIGAFGLQFAATAAEVRRERSGQAKAVDRFVSGYLEGLLQVSRLERTDLRRREGYAAKLRGFQGQVSDAELQRLTGKLSDLLRASRRVSQEQFQLQLAELREEYREWRRKRSERPGTAPAERSNRRMQVGRDGYSAPAN